MKERTGRTRRITERVFTTACMLAVALPLLMLGGLIADVIAEGWSRLSLDFITGLPSRHAEKAGVLPAVVGSLYLIGLTAALALPIGIGAAIHLEEYAPNTRWTRLVEANISNLAGVPSVVYGLLGLEVFVRALGMGRSLLAGACTLALLILPVIIVASREALRTVPKSVREAGAALGASKWQIVRRLVLPMAVPGILTGAILSLSRALGETAPLVVIGALTYVTFLPQGPNSPFTALPIQIFNWVSRPQHAFAINAAAGILVLLGTMLLLNGIAIAIRHRFQKRFG